MDSQAESSPGYFADIEFFPKALKVGTIRVFEDGATVGEDAYVFSATMVLKDETTCELAGVFRPGVAPIRIRRAITEELKKKGVKFLTWKRVDTDRTRQVVCKLKR